MKKINFTDIKVLFFKIPKPGSNYICLAVVTSDSALKKDENYYPQVFLKECKYTKKEKKVISHITDDLEINPFDSDEE